MLNEQEPELQFQDIEIDLSQELLTRQGQPIKEKVCPYCERVYENEEGRTLTLIEALMRLLDIKMEEDNNLTIKQIIDLGKLQESMQKSIEEHTTFKLKGKDINFFLKRAKKALTPTMAMQLTILLTEGRNPFKKGKK